MISLIITFFLGLFCCSGIVNNRLTYQDKSIISTETYICEDFTVLPSSKGVVSLDEYGMQAYFYKSDFLSNQFILTFCRALTENLDSHFSYATATVTNYDWYANTSNSAYGLTDCVYSSYQGTINTDYYHINHIRFEKPSYTYYGDILYSTYNLLFYEGNNHLLFYFTYQIAYPVLDEHEHDLGTQCIFSDMVNVSFSLSYWCIGENDLDTNMTPFISYYYMYLLNANVDMNNERFNAGYNYGYSKGLDDGQSLGYQAGYNAGLQTLEDNNTTASTIFNGIFEIGLLPVNVFLTIFNFEVFGINISGIVSGLLTMSIVIIIVRFLLGGKNDDK